MLVLVLNCGSSSVKYQLLDMPSQTLLAKGLIERIGLKDAALTHAPAGQQRVVRTVSIQNHSDAIRLVLKTLIDPMVGMIQGLDQIKAVGHRVAHGGEMFTHSVVLTEKNLVALEKCSGLAPLHNPANLAGINACLRWMPGVPQVAVFDTAFHQSIPPSAYLYGLPYELYEQDKLRKYGFHGTSHKYVSMRVSEMMGRPLENLKLITCHLGNGASVTAIEGGRSRETSMGFTPLDGLVMGTRCGTLDPALIPYLMEKYGFNTSEVNEFLNKKCGVLGLSGVSSDFRDIETQAGYGNYRARIALDVFVHSVQKYIGSSAAVLDGADALIFTAGLGENSPSMRQAICSRLTYLGLELDPEKNLVCGQEADISTEGSRCRVLVVPTNEELMIAMDTYGLTEQTLTNMER